ncbi:MAG: hypothetical protein E7042_03715 [Lentisphaerae bacterium]|nr:hypothetical protein [Lentisphaerota bacterium]
MGAKKRKRFLAAIVTVCAGGFLAATMLSSSSQPSFRSQPIKKPVVNNSFTPLQLTGLPFFGGGVFDQNTPVYGMSVGGMVHQKEINGLSVAGIHAFNKKKSGLSFSLLDVCHESRGLSIFAAGGAERNYGVSAGFVNLAEHNNGLQLGLINQEKPDAVIENNFSQADPPQGFGVQTGLINYSEGKGLQFGLWNTNPNAWLKHFPLFNFAF